MNFKECVTSSLKSLVSNKMRSFLTMLGIIIGISSVIMISTIGTGGQESISKTFESFTKNIISVAIEPEDGVQLESRDFFTDFDVELLKKTEGVKYVSLTSNFYAYKFSPIENREIYLSISAGNEHIAPISNLKFLKGRNFNKSEVERYKKVIVIDDVFAQKIFGTTDVIGTEIEISTYRGVNYDFLIVGVIENPFKSLMETLRTEIYAPLMPITTAERYIMSYNGQTNLALSAVNQNEKANVEKLVIKSLESIKGKKGVYKIDKSASEEINSFNKVLGIVNIFISAVAAISLFVGGIGVMNIMLVTVTERTKEIGIRKSLGARRRDILIQFLIEAIILTMIGGIIGLTFGYFGAIGIGKLAKIKPILKPAMIILALSVSSITGIIFGVFPAIKASKLNPIDALRYE